MKNNYTTLILSGNATNAIVTMGALQYLYDHNLIINVKKYIGTSSGAILSLLLIIGYTPLEIKTFLCVEKPLKNLSQMVNISNLLLLGKPVLCFEPIKNSIEKLILDKIGFIPTMLDIRDRFQKTLIVTTYNLTDNCREYISAESHPELSVVHAVRMSSSYPLMFEPYRHDQKLYLDGGIVDNFPIEYLQEPGETRLGIITTSPEKKYDEVPNTLELFWKLLQVFIQTITNDKIERCVNCDVIKLNIESCFFNFDTLNSEIIDIFDRGYDECKSQFIYSSIYSGNY
jgi:NTE family protein